MGTSKSSIGPGGGVALVPPWADPEPGSDEQAAPDGTPETVGDLEASEIEPVAAPRRFVDARRQVGSFARTGDTRDLRRGLGSYVRSGYGGSATLTRRLAGVSRSSGQLYNLFATGQLPDGTSLANVVLAASGDANLVLDAVINSLRQPNGTQDAEATSLATRTALTELLQRYPDADLANLDVEQRLFMIERYTAEELFLRVRLDLHAAIVKNAGDAATTLIRLKQLRSYIRQAIAAEFRALGQVLTTAAQVNAVVTEVIRATLTVFEEF